MIISAGETWRLRFEQANNPNNALLHIRAIVDAEYIVYRTWSRRKRDWTYRIDHIGLLSLYLRDGNLKKVKGAT